MYIIYIGGFVNTNENMVLLEGSISVLFLTASMAMMTISSMTNPTILMTAIKRRGGKE
jgi:hypothetical protein